MMIEPRPIYSDQDTITLPLEKYFELHPEIRGYIEKFNHEDNPVALFDALRLFLAGYIRHDQPAEISSTYAYYRGVTERLLLWSWVERQQPLSSLRVHDFKEFLRFCASPPDNWIAASPFRRFISGDDGKRLMNNWWRPFSSASTSEGAGPRALAGIKSICIQIFDYLAAKAILEVNPASQVETSFVNSIGGKGVSLVGRLETEHLEYLLRAARYMCEHDSAHERSLFILAMTIYLLVPVRFMSGNRFWQPTCSSFHKDSSWNYLVFDSARSFKISAPAEFTPYLERYLNARDVSFIQGRLPDVALFTTVHGRPGLSVRQIGNIMRDVSCVAADLMARDGCDETLIKQVTEARMDSIRTASIMRSIDTYGFGQTRGRLAYETLNALHNRFSADSTTNFDM
ncbi:hypothetical protein V7V80_01550 [Pseudomonas kermanshahensis]|uniref:Integrase n=1 Tax=Pseudomonas kermanshahensis TaxID=2745482 RepID=A0ABU8R0H3_9PSED|nr:MULTISPECIES: hypothetical protein [unclassified Pseudomonas]